MVKRTDLKDTPEYQDRVSANNKRMVNNYISYSLIILCLMVIGLVVEYFHGGDDLIILALIYIGGWLVFSLCYGLYALIVPYSIRDYFFINRKIFSDSENNDIYKVKDYDSNKWVTVAERDLWNKIPLNATVTMVVKGRTVVDFYKESYESKASSMVRVFHKTEYNKVETKEMSYEEFQNYMNNGGENK